MHCAQFLDSPEDLFAGVRWSLTVPREWHSTRDVAFLADVIVAKAWPLTASEPPIAEALADLVALVADRYMPVFATASSLRRAEAPESALWNAAAIDAILGVLVQRVARNELSHRCNRTRSSRLRPAGCCRLAASVTRRIAADNPDAVMKRHRRWRHGRFDLAGSADIRSCRFAAPPFSATRAGTFDRQIRPTFRPAV
jgi:hypothetical protein